MSRRVLGLEFREESLAAVLLEIGFKGSELQAQGHFPILPDKTGDEGIKDALAAMVAAVKPAGATCVLGIPATCVSFRNISIPFNDLKKVRQILPFELEPTLPVPVEDLIFDFETVKRDGHQDLLTFAVSKQRIRHYLDLLDTVNLRPAGIMPAGYAAARCLARMAGDEDDFLLVDTGEGQHTVYAVCGGMVRVVRSLPVAGDADAILANLQTAMQRTFTAVRENLGIAVAPTAVYAAGPQSGLLTAKNGHAALLDLPVESIQGMRSFPRLKAASDAPEWQSGELDIALALALMEGEALDGVNFSSEQSTISHYWSEYRGKIITTALLILFSLAVAMTTQFLALNGKKRRLADLDRQIEMVFKGTFPEVTRIVDPLQQMRIKINTTAEGGLGSELPGARVRIIDILDTLSQQIPATVDVKITRMVVGIDNVVLSGNTDTFNTVDDIKGRLGKADTFASVIISSADLEKSGKRVRFKLKMDF